MGNLREFLTVKEAADYLGVTATTLRNWDRQGKFTAYRHPVNNYRLYKKEELEALLKNLRKPKKQRRK